MKEGFATALLKILAKIFGNKIAGAVKEFFGFLESLGINPGVFLIIVTIAILVYVVVDFIRLRRKPITRN